MTATVATVQPDQAEAPGSQLMAENSRAWAEFRLAVVEHLVVCRLQRGQLEAELKLLAAKQWNHPITGKPVVFGYSTIARWYYVVLNNPKERFRGLLSGPRSDAGIPRSLSKQVRGYLISQANNHKSWSYTRQHQILIQTMNERDWGPPPSYMAVRRYLLSIGSSRDVQDDVQLARLKGLVAHLRKHLIVQSTVIRLMKVPELRVKMVATAFRFVRIGRREKLYVLSRLKDHKTAGGSLQEFCSGVGISTSSVERWGASYARYGMTGLCARVRRKFSNRTSSRETAARLLEIFHHQPRAYDINRASWTGKSLADALQRTFRVTISGPTASRHLRKSGYTMRRARQVLSSPDPDYRAKVETLLRTLQTLGETEMYFFVDELGPLAVKKYGGRALVKNGETFIVPQLQTPKGSIILAGALSATTNQMTWCFGHSKDTRAMIDLIEILFCEHRDKTRLYITWDAASWHDSISLVDWLDVFNRHSTKAKEGPQIALVPLPSCSQFLNVIESVFGVMKKTVIHHSNYQSAQEMKSAISRHFRERNQYFKTNPKRAGQKIWEIDFFQDPRSLRSGNYRDY